MIAVVCGVQIASAIKELVSQAGGADKPHIICGDFNSTPYSAGYQLARDGYLNDRYVTSLQQLDRIEASDGEVSHKVQVLLLGTSRLRGLVVASDVGIKTLLCFCCCVEDVADQLVLERLSAHVRQLTERLCLH